MGTLSTLNANVKIAIITLNSKSYYKITKILRSQGFHFLSLTPEDKIPNSIKLVITTNSEKQLIPEINYLTVEELSNSKTQRCIIISRLSSTGFNNITDTDGNTHSLSTYLNDGKYVVLNFYLLIKKSKEHPVL